MRNRVRAFTLIELLVVISIIALLLAIMMPALGTVKRRARRVTCGAHMKNISLVLNLYAMDNNSRLPSIPDLPGIPPAEEDDYFVGEWLFDVPANVAENVRQQYQLESIYCPANTLKRKKDRELEDYFVSHMNVDEINDVDESTTGWAVSDYFWLLTFNADRRKGVNNPVYPRDTRNSGKKIFIDRTSIRNASSRPLVVDLVFTQDTTEPKDWSQINGAVEFSSNHLNSMTAEGGNVLKVDGSVEWRNLSEMDRNYIAPDGGGDVQHYW